MGHCGGDPYGPALLPKGRHGGLPLQDAPGTLIYSQTIINCRLGDLLLFGGKPKDAGFRSL